MAMADDVVDDSSCKSDAKQTVSIPNFGLASLPLHVTFRILSQSPLVIEGKGFLTEEECVTLLAAVEDLPCEAGVDAADKAKYPLGDLAFQSGSKEQELLNRVRTDVDNLLGSTSHSRESCPVIHYTPATALATDTSGPRMGLGLHLDTNHRPMRFATAIVYLSTLPESADGATVFPCASANATSDDQDDQCQGRHGLAQDADTVVSGSSESAGFQHTGQAIRAQHPDAVASAAAAKRLLQAAENRQNGLNIKPEAGKLCLFFSRGVDGSIDTRSFHGGANVNQASQEGDGRHKHLGKWTLQIFREAPYDESWAGPLLAAATGSGKLLPEVEMAARAHAATSRKRLLASLTAAKIAH